MPAARELAPWPAVPASTTTTRPAPSSRAKTDAQPPTVPAPTTTRSALSLIASTPFAKWPGPWTSNGAPSTGRELPRVGQDRHGGVAAVEGDDAAPRVRGGTAEVQPGHRRARRQAVLPHLIRGDLALEDVAAGEPDALLDVRRAEDLVGLDAVVEARREAVDQVDELARDLLTAAVPGALGEVVWRVLAKHAEQMLAHRRRRRVVAGLQVDLAEAHGRLAAVAGLEGALGLLQAAGDVDGRARRPGLPRRRGPVGQRVERGVELDHGAADLPLLQAPAVVGRHVLALEQRERDLRVGVAQHGARVDAGAVLEHDAHLRLDGRHRHAAGEDGARLLRGVGEGEADHPHPALDVAPHGAPALEVALVVHELDRCRAGVLGPAVGGDDALAEERVLQALVAHVVVEHLRDRGAEDDVEHRLLAAQQLLDLRARRRLAHPRVARAGAQLAADLVEQVLIGPVTLDVLGDHAEVAKVALGARVVQPLPEGGAVLERDPQVGIRDEALKAACAQAELGDDQLVEEADHVGARAHDEAPVRERALERARAAQALAALEHEHGAAGARQVGRGGQPVVAATDHDGVPVARGELGQRLGEPDLAEPGCDLVHGLLSSLVAARGAAAGGREPVLISASTATAPRALTSTGLSSSSSRP